MNKEIEHIFRNSNSPDELFDTFRKAITHHISDIELYKILLANPVLSGEELKMYTEHLSKVFSENAFDLFVWTGRIFSNLSSDYERMEDSISYFVKAIYKNPQECEPYLRLLQLYNYEINIPTNSVILEVAESFSDKVKNKRLIYDNLAKLYERKGDSEKAMEYKRLSSLS